MFGYSFQKKGKIVAEYIWIDGSGVNLRSKSRTLVVDTVNSLKDIPNWSFDGSSTGQASVDNSELVLTPVFFCKDPFRIRRGLQNAILVLCTTWKWETINNEIETTSMQLDNCRLVPANTNFRSLTLDLWDYLEQEKLQFGIEQEYLIVEKQNETVSDVCNNYCQSGKQMNLGRKISEEHYQMCLEAGLDICGTNSEVLNKQWEYQIGICDGIEVADQLWMSRFILYRVAESYKCNINLNPKPFTNFSGSGAHVNWSTLSMRNQAILNKQNFNILDTYDLYKEMLDNLKDYHKQHIQFFGIDNQKRLTGKHETSSYDELTYGVADRNRSLRIATNAYLDKKIDQSRRIISGYIEDRRPAANMDPYVVCSLIVHAALAPAVQCLSDELQEAYNIYLNSIQQDQ